MREAITKQALNKAAAGNSPLIRMLLTLIPIFEARFEQSRACNFGTYSITARDCKSLRRRVPDN